MPPLADREGRDPQRFNVYHALSIFLVSASIIFLQIALMRSMSITRYHHFSYLVISTALLGFGASGTVLTFLSRRIRKHFNTYMSIFIFCFLIVSPLSYYVAEEIPLDMQYLFFGSKQLILFMLYNLCIFIPFFCGAMVIGSALMYFEMEVPLVYGANMFGSGIGGVMTIGALFLFPATSLPPLVSVLSLFSLISWVITANQDHKIDNRPHYVIIVATAIVCTFIFLFIKPHVTVDQYKSLSHLEDLEREGNAEKIITVSSPRGQIDVYDSKNIHHVMFAGLNADVLPPPQLAILIDGNYAGSVFMIDSADNAGILDFTPQSLPYRLVDSPRVLLLGEVGGVNIWLAKRFGAKLITVVREDPLLNNMMMNELAEISGNIFTMKNVNVINKEPFLYIEQSNERFDIIQIVSAEGMSAGVSGLQSLHEDYMLTVESISRSYGLLTDSGMISLTRGIQSPPRDNVKVFALFAEALEMNGVDDIGGHLMQSRNYLAANTILSKRALHAEMIGKYVTSTKKLLMDAEYYPGINSDTIKQLNVVQGPDGMDYSFYHYGAMKVLSKDRNELYDEWAYAIRPPTDDRPYFYDFFKWSSMKRFIESYGEQWLQRLELGYLVLIVAFLEIVIVAVLFILVPLFFAKTGIKETAGKGVTLLYFLFIGIGFMFIEMILIQWLTRFMGSPVYSVAVALTSVLVFAGLGSMYQQNREREPVKRVRRAVLGIMIVTVVYLLFLDTVLSSAIAYSVAVRFIITALLLAPISFFMGWMFPVGMIRLEKRAKNLIPWAWGINGFASVSAAPLAIMLSMSFGFKAVLVIALLLYVAAGGVIKYLGAEDSRGRGIRGNM
jgi:MFS family permease